MGNSTSSPDLNGKIAPKIKKIEFELKIIAFLLYIFFV